MTNILHNLTSSRIVSRNGNTLQVRQEGIARFGVFSLYVLHRNAKSAWNRENASSCAKFPATPSITPARWKSSLATTAPASAITPKWRSIQHWESYLAGRSLSMKSPSSPRQWPPRWSDVKPRNNPLRRKISRPIRRPRKPPAVIGRPPPSNQHHRESPRQQ